MKKLGLCDELRLKNGAIVYVIFQYKKQVEVIDNLDSNQNYIINYDDIVSVERFKKTSGFDDRLIYCECDFWRLIQRAKKKFGILEPYSDVPKFLKNND